MKTLLMTTLLFLTSLVMAVQPMPLHAVEKTDDDVKTVTETLADLQSEPRKLTKAIQTLFNEVQGLSFNEPESASEKLEELSKQLSDLKPKKTDSKKIIGRAKKSIRLMKKILAKSGKPLDEQKKLFAKKTTDTKLLTLLSRKMASEVIWLSGNDAKKATARLAEHEEFFNSITEKLDDTKKNKINKTRNRYFLIAKKMLAQKGNVSELIGKDAASLNVKGWVNGTPLTDKDLKGKVVVLDFWAVWCGPCRAMFPALKEWHGKYGEKDLVIIGMTRFYNYKWDDTKNSYVKGTEKVPQAEEIKMLEKFSVKYKLSHRFAIQNGSTLSGFYGVRGIPHLVVIDKEGKVRRSVSGYSKQSAQQTGKLIQQLIAE